MLSGRERRKPWRWSLRDEDGLAKIMLSHGVDVDRGSDGDEVEAAEEEEILAAVLQMGHQA